MDGRQRIAYLAQNKEDEVLLSHLYEQLTMAESKNIMGASCFLSKREQMLAQELLKPMPVTFFGGTQDAERCVCVYLPDYLEESALYEPDSPVAAVRATFFEKDTLTHRDFLGSLMGCGIKRETVGDIHVRTGACDFLVLRKILPYVLQNLLDAGRTRLHLTEIPLQSVVVPEQPVKVIRDTVSSLRLDAVVSAGFSVSRGKAAEYIAAGKCELNYLPCMKPDQAVSEKDRITIRGLGKCSLQEVGGTTKKGRITLILHRYL